MVDAPSSLEPEKQFVLGAGISTTGLFIIISAYTQIYQAGEELEQVDNTVE